jgi:ATP-binding cassette subfamily B protein
MSDDSHNSLDSIAVSKAHMLRLLARIFASLGPYKWCLLAGNIGAFVCIFADLQMITGLRAMLNSSDLFQGALWPRIAPILLWALVNRVSGGFQFWISSYAANRAMHSLRCQFFERLQTLSKSFYDRHRAGWLVARGTGDMQILSDYMVFAIMMLVIFCTAIFGSLFRIASISPVLLLPCLITLPAAAVATFHYRRHMVRTQREARERNSAMVANLTENIRGVREVQAFAREDVNLAHFNDLNRQTRDTELKAARLNAMFLPGMDLIGVINIITVIAFGSWLLRNPDSKLLSRPLTGGDLAAYFLYMNMVLWPMRMVFELYSWTLRACEAARRIFGIVDITPEVQDAEDARPVERMRGEVEFRSVGFRYGSTDSWILRDFNLRIEAGETLALVGKTGAGKTTVSSLIARFYDVQEGLVLVDGQDVRKLEQESYHSHMGIVLQDGFLFSGSVMDNLRFRHPELSDGEVVAAARRLGTHECMLRLPDGYATEVHEGGRSVSEGQRQLISLTRALIAEPKILILDESTSALDSYTERKVQEALETLIRGRTTLIIAHRLSTVRCADRIVVMDGGRIVEEGTHERLVELKGAYCDFLATAGGLGRQGGGRP